MEFEVTSHRYSVEKHRLHFEACGYRDGVQFTVVTTVPCTSEPRTREAVNAVVLLRLNEIFRGPSASGR